MVPDRFRSAFSHATLKTLDMHGGKFAVSDALFFRGAYTANVL